MREILRSPAARAAGWTGAFYLMALPLVGPVKALWAALAVILIQGISLIFRTLSPARMTQIRLWLAGEVDCRPRWTGYPLGRTALCPYSF